MKQQDQVSCNVAAILQRGHTVDRLTEAELQEVAENITALQKQRASTAPAASNGAASSGEGAKNPEPKTTNAAPDDEAKPADEQKKESKAERKKRLHARNMRYYRSFLSSSLSTYSYMTASIMSLPMDLKSNDDCVIL